MNAPLFPNLRVSGFDPMQAEVAALLQQTPLHLVPVLDLWTIDFQFLWRLGAPFDSCY